MMMMKILATTATLLALVATRHTAHAQCLNQSEALLANENLAAAAADAEDQWNADYAADPDQFCTLDVDLSCTINFEAYSADFKDVCVIEGGQIVEVDIITSCSASGDVPALKFNMINVPECVGLDCDPAALPDEIKEAFVSIGEASESIFEESGFGECTTSVAVDSSAPADGPTNAPVDSPTTAPSGPATLTMAPSGIFVGAAISTLVSLFIM